MNQHIQRLAALNPDALLLEPRDVYDSCVVDITDNPHDHWPRQTPAWVAVYDGEAVLEATSLAHDCTHEEAAEHVGYNMVGAWLGDGTPTFRWEDWDLEE